MTKLIKKNKLYKIQTDSEIEMGVFAKDIINYEANIDLSITRKDEKEIINNHSGIEKQNILFLNQVHGDKIISINSLNVENKIFENDADAFITNLKNVCLVIRTADCVPVLFIDTKKEVIGAAHSGWKSTELQISAKLISKMKNEYNSNPKDIKVYILPSIGPDSYQVNEEVSDKFPGDFKILKSGIYLNLWKNIIESLTKIGISESNIFNSEICNYKNSNEFFSHRKGDAGRNLNFIYMK